MRIGKERFRGNSGECTFMITGLKWEVTAVEFGKSVHPQAATAVMTFMILAFSVERPEAEMWLLKTSLVAVTAGVDIGRSA